MSLCTLCTPQGGIVKKSLWHTESRLRVFAFEHITGGGMLDDPLMSALAPDGDRMLRALVDDLLAIPGVDVAVMRDPRLQRDIPATMFVPQSAGGFRTLFREVARACDAVWPIAPESGDILLRTTTEALASGRRLLGCRPDAVAVASSKAATAGILARAGIAVVPCHASEAQIPEQITAIVVKPDDGAGCQDTLLFRDRDTLRQWLGERGTAGKVVQPYVHGDARSLSLVCCDGSAKLLACNRQDIRIEDGVFHYGGVHVNAIADADDRYAQLAAAIARALPGLWGYCGVDFIETAQGPVVVEVNPRLTTAYAGLRDAIGANPAQLVLGLPGSLAAHVPAIPKFMESGITDGI